MAVIYFILLTQSCVVIYIILQMQNVHVLHCNSIRLSACQHHKYNYAALHTARGIFGCNVVYFTDAQQRASLHHAADFEGECFIVQYWEVDTVAAP